MQLSVSLDNESVIWRDSKAGNDIKKKSELLGEKTENHTDCKRKID